MLNKEDIKQIEKYLNELERKYNKKLEDNRIPPLNKGLQRIYDEKVEELRYLQKKLFNERYQIKE